MYQLELAQLEDLPLCMEVLRSGRLFQRQQGFFQWPDGFPKEEIIRSDIQNGNGYVLRSAGIVAAYLYIGFDGDPYYPAIEGAWLNDAPYAVIHRVAIGSDFRGKGLADIIFALAEDVCRSRGVRNLRIDTHAQNQRMQHILEKNGYRCCGTVMQDNGPRLAYHKAFV